MIRRILHFNKQDWRHIAWLFSNILRGLWNGDWNDVKDAWFWVRLHLEYDSDEVSDRMLRKMEGDWREE